MGTKGKSVLLSSEGRRAAEGNFPAKFVFELLLRIQKKTKKNLLRVKQ